MHLLVTGQDLISNGVHLSCTEKVASLARADAYFRTVIQKENSPLMKLHVCGFSRVTVVTISDPNLLFGALITPRQVPSSFILLERMQTANISKNEQLTPEQHVFLIWSEMSL